MSSIANLGSAVAVLPAVNIHPHVHKKGAHTESTGDSNSGTAAQVPVAAAQNLFGSLLRTLEQVVGLQPATAATNASVAASSGRSVAASAASGPAVGANVNVKV